MKKWLQVIGWTLLAVLAYYVLEVLFNTVFRSLVRTATSKEQYTRYTLLANLVMKSVLLFVYGFWYKVREFKWNFRPDYQGAFTPKNIVCLLGIGVFGQYAVRVLVGLIRMVAPAVFTEYEKVTQIVQLEGGSPLLMILLVVVIGPIAEEVLFRGVIYGKLREVFTLTQAAVISGAIFGIYHKNIIQGLYAWLFGILLAYIFEKTQTIWGAIVMHMMFNLSAYGIKFLQGLQKMYSITFPAVFYFALDIVCVAFVLIAMAALRKRPNRYDEIQKKENEIELLGKVLTRK